MIKVLEIKPTRTCKKEYANYSSYKPYLRGDFNARCGYCDCDDYHVGGHRGFQIDHFKPKKHFAELETQYSNLVYSCPYCNRAKWDKWRAEEGFIDPCSEEYDVHLYRNECGQICYHTERGKYVFEELNLGLTRHETLWLIRKLEAQSEALNQYIEKVGDDHAKELEVLRSFREIQNKIREYTKLFRADL